MFKMSVNTAKNRNNKAKTGVFRSIKHNFDRNKLGELLVLKGNLTPQDLKHILSEQKNTNKRLGELLIEQSYITKSQLSRLLFKQKAMRMTAAMLLCFASFGGFTKKSHAKEIKDVPARIALVSAGAGQMQFEELSHYPKLFGAKEKRSTNLKAFTKWSSMFERFDNALNDQKSRRIIDEMLKEVAQYKSGSIHKMAQNVNRMMNQKKYIVDNRNWGKSDYWATPIEFLTRGGDCEDFAIAKYVALRALGVPENRMRIAIVQDQKKNIPHAILVVYSEQGAVILDNQIKTVERESTIAHYKPIFSINREAWWLHTTPKSSTTIVASATR